MMTSSEPPAPWASSAISPTAATASAVERPALARLCPSEADTTYSRFAIPASTARTAPRGLATSADQWTSPQRDSSAATCSASARAGTAFGETKDVTSIRRTPVATSASSISSLASSGTGASSCRPSRIPTSRTSTVVGSTRSNSYTRASSVGTSAVPSDPSCILPLVRVPLQGDPERFHDALCADRGIRPAR